MLELTIKIILAHLLGDFVFQNNKMVEDINENKLKSISLYKHVSIHLILILVFTGFDKQFIIPAILLTLAHFLIDATTKIFLRNKIKALYLLVLDQMLHFLTIAIFIRYYFEYSLNPNLIFNTKSYLLGIALICTTFVSSIIIKKSIAIFNYQISTNGIENAGKYIGILERLFVFSFVLMSFWEGIGFLLAAKSIFRFGDLRKNKDVKLTEYILIGTLLSFGLAILIGLGYVKALAYLSK